MPFVDYPELCYYIWGNKSDEQFYCSEEHGAEIFVPAASEEIDFGLHPLSRPFSAKVQVRGRGLNEGASLAVTDEYFTLDKATLSANEIHEGTDVSISVTPTEEGTYTTMLLLEGSGYVQQTPLTVSFVDGIPAYPATDIVCAVSSRRFNANWMNYQPDATYTLNVYTKDGMAIIALTKKGQESFNGQVPQDPEGDAMISGSSQQSSSSEQSNPTSSSSEFNQFSSSSTTDAIRPIRTQMLNKEVRGKVNAKGARVNPNNKANYQVDFNF